MLFTLAIGLFTSRVILNTLGVEDFGIYNVVGGIVAMFGFINSAMATSTSRHLTFELGANNEHQLIKVFNLSIYIHGIISLIVIILGETIGLYFLYTQMQIPVERMTAALWVYQLSIASSVITIMSVPYNALIIAHEKMSAFAYITILDISLKLLIVYMILIFPWDKLIIYAILLLIAQIINQGIYMIYCKSKFKETKLLWLWDKSLFKEMSSFAGWNLVGNIAVLTYTEGLNILLNVFFGPATNAARGIAVQVQNVIGRFTSNFQTALNPQITKTYASHDLEYMHKLIFASSKYSFFLLLTLSTPLIVETSKILTLWLKLVPDNTVVFLRIIIATSLIDTLANPLIIAAQATGHIRIYQQVVGGLLILILPISYVALKLGLPSYSVFLVHLGICIIAQIARLIMIKPLIHLSVKKYFHSVITKILRVTFASVLLSFIIYKLIPQSQWSFIVTISCIIPTTILLVYLGGLDKNEKLFINNKILTILHRKQ